MKSYLINIKKNQNSFLFPYEFNFGFQKLSQSDKKKTECNSKYKMEKSPFDDLILRFSCGIN